MTVVVISNNGYIDEPNDRKEFDAGNEFHGLEKMFDPSRYNDPYVTAMTFEDFVKKCEGLCRTGSSLSTCHFDLVLFVPLPPTPTPSLVVGSIINN